MAFQYGLPQLFITESSKSSQDVFELGGIIPFRVLVWDSSKALTTFLSVEWKKMLQNWAVEVRTGYYIQTLPYFEYTAENQ